MMLIAESGSTKTDWRAVDKTGTIQQFITLGFNPFHQKSESISLEIKTNLLNRLTGSVSQVHFYGAGCSSKVMCAVVETALNECFPAAEIFVNHDLLAAARGLCGHEKGIACIIGTGSNSCVFDGKDITANIPALGYILGDEGSGAYMGKQFLADYIIGLLPEKLATDFSEKFGLDKDKIFEAVYQKPLPNRFLASFGKFLFQRIDDPYVMSLVRSSFVDFFDRYICRYEGYAELPVHFTGSIAFYFSKILSDVAAEKHVRIGRIVETPAAALVLYHTNKE
jgi:glucosamine kinase